VRDTSNEREPACSQIKRQKSRSVRDDVPHFLSLLVITVLSSESSQQIITQKNPLSSVDMSSDVEIGFHVRRDQLQLDVCWIIEHPTPTYHFLAWKWF
jgi:hypothetical protein